MDGRDPPRPARMRAGGGLGSPLTPWQLHWFRLRVEEGYYDRAEVAEEVARRLLAAPDALPPFPGTFPPPWGVPY